jgi:hypothetical protein
MDSADGDPNMVVSSKGRVFDWVVDRPPEESERGEK